MLEIKKGAGYGKSCPKVEKFFEEFPTIVICGQAYPPVRTKPRASEPIVERPISCRDYHFGK